jgi:hypothetical protein
MLNAYSLVHYKAFAFILSPQLLSTTSAHPSYKQCCLEGGSRYEDVAGVLTAKIRQPSHEFTFGVGMSFIPYPLVLTPVV